MQPAAFPTHPDAELAFHVDDLRVVIRKSRHGDLAHYLLFRDGGDSGKPVLLGSGSEHETGACLHKALQAARRARGGR